MHLRKVRGDCVVLRDLILDIAYSRGRVNLRNGGQYGSLANDVAEAMEMIPYLYICSCVVHTYDICIDSSLIIEKCEGSWKGQLN